MNSFLKALCLTLAVSVIFFPQLSLGAAPQGDFGFTTSDPQLSRNRWIGDLYYNEPILQYAIADAGNSMSVAEGYFQCQAAVQNFAEQYGNWDAVPPSCGTQTQLVEAQILLNHIVKKGPGLAALLSAGSYKKAWAYAAQNQLTPMLETPVGFQLLGQKHFTKLQMIAFYTAALPYWTGTILGQNPYPPTLWGDPSHLASDAVTNSQTLGDNLYPDIARFAGKQASEGFLEKWAIPIVIAVVAAVVTVGIGDAVAAGIDTAVGATSTDATFVAADGTTLVSSSLTTSEGTLLSTSVSALAPDGTIVAGSTITNYTIAGTAINAGSNAFADAAVAAAQGQNIGKAFLGGILGGIGVSVIPTGATSYSPGAVLTNSLENGYASPALATYAGSSLNGALENGLTQSSGSTTTRPGYSPTIPVTTSISAITNPPQTTSRAPASVPPPPKENRYNPKLCRSFTECFFGRSENR